MFEVHTWKMLQCHLTTWLENILIQISLKKKKKGSSSEYVEGLLLREQPLRKQSTM